MYMTVIKLVWPYAMRYIANNVAQRLQSRREQRLQAAHKLATVAQLPDAQLECPPCPPCPPCPAIEEMLNIKPEVVSSRNKIWFALSGLLLGSAFGAMIYLFFRDSGNR